MLTSAAGHLSLCVVGLLATVPLAAAAEAPASPSSSEPLPMIYPAAPRDATVDEYHGVRIADPYRWLEDANSPETKAWVEAQNALSRPWLASIPQQASFLQRLTQLWNYPREGLPRRAGPYTFATFNSGLRNQPLYRVQEGTGEPRDFLDPLALNPAGTTAISGFAPSEDGRLVMYAVSQGGSDWDTFYIRDTVTGQDLPDKLEHIKFGSALWNREGTGFYYVRFPAPAEGQALAQVNENPGIYFHRLGQPQADDTHLYSRPEEPRLYLFPALTEDRRWLLIYTSRGSSNNGLLIRDLDQPNSSFVTLFDQYDASYTAIGNVGSTVFLQTNKDAPLGRLMALDAANFTPGAWREVIPEGEHLLDSVVLVGGHLVVQRMVHATHRLYLHRLDGSLVKEIELPGLGAIAGLSAREEDPDFFFGFSSYNRPATIYRYDIPSGALAMHYQPPLTFDPEIFATDQVFYESRDGTRVPMFVTYRKDRKGQGPRPTILYGYGGFNVSLQPGFSPTILAWVEADGVYAVANLRGGGEYGKKWHDAGRIHLKQNVFDDFIAAAEYLIHEGWTTNRQLGTSGGSNGGLLTAATMLQRPDLFGGVHAAVGVMDMLRFHKFTVGWGWVQDYGSSDDPAQFATLLRYSPLHNVRPGISFPPILLTTADHDDRVVPAHTFKFAATLQHYHLGPNPVVVRIETKAGHGAGMSTAQRLALSADELAFFARTLGL